MVGLGSDAHIVMIMENYLAPMAIFAFEISLDRFDNIQPVKAGQGSATPQELTRTTINKTAKTRKMRFMGLEFR